MSQPSPTESGQGEGAFAPGNELLAKAINQLEHHASVTARLRHQASIAGQDVYGVGSYWQQGSGDDLKIRLELQVAGQNSQLLQICNGHDLWFDRQLPAGRVVTRYNMRQLRTDPTLAASNPDSLEPGNANWSAIQPFLSARSGGLPSLLSALRENFSFLPPQPMRLAITPSASSEPVSVPVYVVVGQWKPEKLAALLAQNEDGKKDERAQRKSKTPKPRPLPERLPQEVLLLVGQSDLFPYRIEYRQLETPVINSPPQFGEGTGEGQPIPYQLSVHPLAVMELSDVVFDAPIDAGQFDYTPGNADWDDQTAQLLERFHRQHDAQVATRPAPENAIPSRQ